VDISILLKDMQNVKHSVDILKSVQAETLCALQRLCDQTQPCSTVKSTLPPHVDNSNTVQSDIVLTENSSTIGDYRIQNHELKGQSYRSTRNSPDSSIQKKKPLLVARAKMSNTRIQSTKRFKLVQIRSALLYGIQLQKFTRIINQIMVN
jgi:hypothetical protein